jgi:hypothetical protein
VTRWAVYLAAVAGVLLAGWWTTKRQASKANPAP